MVLTVVGVLGEGGT